MTGAEAPDRALRAVADDLYGLRPGEFTAARSAAEKQARNDGDRQLAAAVKALRRPSVAAWAVNLLVRERRDLVTQVVELGASLREAQAHLAGDSLRELTRQRRQLVAAVTAEARVVASAQGESLSDAAARQVEETLQAAMTDRSAADAVLTGLLTQPLSSTGLDTLGELLAVPGVTGRGPEPADERDDNEDARPGLRVVPPPEETAEEKAARAEEERLAARRDAEQRLARAERTAAAASSALDGVRKKQSKRQARVLQLENELEELRRRVAELEEATDQAAERLSDFDSRVEEAEVELAGAQAEVDAARAALDALG